MKNSGMSFMAVEFITISTPGKILLFLSLILSKVGIDSELVTYFLAFLSLLCYNVTFLGKVYS